MTTTELHHYVPRFYLRRFADPNGRLWLWDRKRDRVFAAKPGSIAAETNFYYLDAFAERGLDPFTMEKQFSRLEAKFAWVTDQWLTWFRDAAAIDKIILPRSNRQVVSQYIALQSLRTLETREILGALIEGSQNYTPESGVELREAHTTLLWNMKIFRQLAKRILRATWIFAKNQTVTPFITSDNPVLFRTRDNAMWLKPPLSEPDAYIIFPLAPDVIMYCFPRLNRKDPLIKFDKCLSPACFTDTMARDENTGQVFMASRFLISPRNIFDAEREFAKTIGTDIFARDRTPNYNVKHC